MSHSNRAEVPVRLESLTVRRFRHVAEPAHLEFGPGHTLIIGRNGTGKTNLLRLIDAVTRLDFSSFASDPLPHDLSFRLRWGELTLSMNLSSELPEREGGRRKAVRFDGNASTSTGQSVDFEVGSGEARGGHPLEKDEERPDPYEVGPTPRIIGDAWLRPMSRVWNYLTSANGRFDEALESSRVATEANGEGYAQLFVQDDAGRPAGLGYRMIPEDLARTWFGRTAPERLKPVSEEVPWLTLAASACGFDRLEVHASVPRETSHPPEIVSRTYAPFTWYAQRGRSKFPHQDFSFGQKRIVAAFWYLACVRDAGGVVVADEMVNGLHHEALRLLLEQCEGLQGFFASQNPLLFDMMEYASEDDFQKRIVRCDPHADGWSWRNPTTEESRRFLEGYEAGFQHVSAILRTDGLW
jgi:hypothetical protein